MKRIILGLMLLVLMAGAAWAQTPDAGWEVFVIRNGSTLNPVINDASGTYGPGAIEVATTEGGQKVGLATDGLNGATVGQIGSLYIDRLDDIGASGSLYGPYFNVWVTDGLGNYAVIANEPSNAEWGGNQWDIYSWDFLKTKTCKVYETPGAGTGTSWLHTLIGNPGPLVFDDVKDLVIEPPSVAYITNPANAVGTGAPDNILDNTAYGYTWVFGDTAANYVSGTGPGFIVANYIYSITFPVNNTTQVLGYNTISAAVADANANDFITVAAGTYTETVNINVDGLTITGDDQATVIIDPTGFATNNAGVYVDADNVTLSTLTVNSTVTTSLPRYGVKVGAYDGFTLVDVTITEIYRSGFDGLDSTNMTLTRLTVTGNGGHGLSLVDVDGANVTDFTALGNGWQNVSVATWGRYSTLGTSGIVFSGTNVFGDLFQLEMGDYNNPGVAPAGDAIITYSTNILDGADVTVSGSELGFAVHGDQDDGPDQVRIWFMSSLANAALVPANVPFGHWLDTNMFIEDLVDGTQVHVTPGCSIKAAIAAAPSGGTVNVAGGTYVEDGQILVDHTVDVIGDPLDRAIVMTNMNTGSSGDPRGWFLQTAGHLVLRNLELDGTTYNIYQGIRAYGSGELDNCALRNMVHPGYAGVALAAFGTGNWDVTDCTFDDIGRVGFLAFGSGLNNSSFVGNTYTGKGTGDHLDYACDISNGAIVNVEGNTITGNTGVASTDGSTSAALLVTTYFGPGTTATINDNVLTGNTTGVAVGFDAADVSVVSGSGNDLSGNADSGVSNTAANWVDFSGNWWGDASGPFHPTLNPGGTGVNVGDFIIFEPWSGSTSIAAAPAATGPIPCGTDVTLTFSLTTDEYTPDVFGYNAVVRAPAGVTFGTITDLEAFGATTTFLPFDNGDGSWTISATSTGSPSMPITSAGIHSLFSIVFTPTLEGTQNITLENLLVRDPVNAPIPVVGTGASFDVDCTAPAPVTAITADPANKKINVGWTHDGTDVANYEVWRGLWHDGTPGDSAYPEYDDVNPTAPVRPSSRTDAFNSAEWDLAATVAVGTNTFADTWADQTSRGVYYYEVFPVDAATNYGPTAAANDRATNYWLGDVWGPVGNNPDPNGVVDVGDMDQLGAKFGLPVPTGDPINVLDVGPTDDWSRLGIPLTDDVINFEDLIVFAMNFGVVSAAKSQVQVGTAVDLVWVDYGNGTKALRLEGGNGLKGVRVTADVKVSNVSAGSLLDEQSELTFVQNVGDKLDVSVAVMGVNTTFEGTGDLFVVSTDAEITMAGLTITARAIDNSTMKVSLEAGSDAATPRVFALNGNYPNPFNPMTKISFSLPASHDVRLSVYSLDGRLVRTLLNETRGPGLHEIVWNGQDNAGRGVSSGTYFYRVDAGPYSDVKKMTLMK